MKIKISGIGAFLRIPVQSDADAVKVIICEINKKPMEVMINLAKTRIDFWSEIFLGNTEKERTITLEIEKYRKGFTQAIELCREEVLNGWEMPAFHYSRSKGYLGRIIKLVKEDGWKMTYQYNPFGHGDAFICQETVHGESLLCLNKKEHFVSLEDMQQIKDTALPAEYIGDEITGDIQDTAVFTMESQDILIARSRKFAYGGKKYCHVYTVPLKICKEKGGRRLVPFQELRKLWIWKREWKAEGRFYQKLAFRTVPGKWPNIHIEKADGKAGDISAKAFEININFSNVEARQVTVHAAGISFTWNRQTGLLCSGKYFIIAGMGQGLEVTVYSDYGCGEILCNGKVIFRTKAESEEEVTLQAVDNEISGNLENCRLSKKSMPFISIAAEDNVKLSAALVVYGLRDSDFNWETKNQINNCMPDEKVIFKSRHYTVYHNHVEDGFYGEPHAWAIHSGLVYSPVRVVEEFEWRATPWGDMVRAINRTHTWRPDSSILAYPQFTTGIPVIDAAYNIAVDTLIQCKKSRYALEGQEGMWSAGLFQGEKEGFGVWMRDSAHIALRGGNLLDPKGARKTLLYAANKGFDNGSDGYAMAACGIWDYYLATGDKSVLFELWEKLVQNMEEADKLFCENRNLMIAKQSTSNDSLEEPENNGFCLSTECYFMMAFEAMAKMGKLTGEKKERVEHWKLRAQTMRASIKENYWNDTYGYYTSGPRGSEAFEKGVWETSGQESVIWSRFHIASQEQKKIILSNVEKTAMCEYGIILFPHKNKINHFCGSVWTVWEAGFAAAASECGDHNLIWKLIAQQVRNCIINKTFYEVVDGECGKAWRWPGQLWHAAGFLSLILFGILGIEYGEEGMRFHPSIPEIIGSVSLKGLTYGTAVLNIKTEGTGAGHLLYLDGAECDVIGRGISGQHEVRLIR